jgi:outer membrane protein OmpA-like peptidoglycan-associated protein/opacity protein-like surface antigen
MPVNEKSNIVKQKPKFMSMKKHLLYLILSFVFLGATAQTQVKDHYTVSGGLLGAANFSNFRITGDNVGNVAYKLSPGWAAGAWVNFPMGKVVSFEPQLLYSAYEYDLKDYAAGLLGGKIYYFSIPLQLRFAFGKAFAVTAGGQIDLVNTVKDINSNYQTDKEQFSPISYGAIGGVEFFPHSVITIFGRYEYGFNNMDNTDNPNTAIKFYNQNIQAGVKLKLFGKHIVPPPDTDGDGVIDPNDKCPTVAGLEKYQGCPIPDTDGDGLNDEQDKCPNVAGVAKYQGCPVPDKDKDGIVDDEDKCPDVAGLAKYQGCPIPDTDKDGINDEQDKCPTVAGLAKYQGCPIPDTDGDGLNDENDQCPTVPGTAKMKGCPEIEKFSASSVTFASGKSVLTGTGKAELNKVVEYLNKYPSLKVQFDGHTDSQGSDALNLKLSKARADAARAYVMSKGISDGRIITEGFGEGQPVDDNKTAAGRAKNRRVEVNIL